MEASNGHYLNLGSGDPVPGWLNLDCSPLFLAPRWMHHGLAMAGFARCEPYRRASYGFLRWTKMVRLPLAPASAEAVYCSHFLEHLEPRAIEALVAECGRVLRAGGVLRIVVPDLQRKLEDILRADQPAVNVAASVEAIPPLLEAQRLRAALEGLWGFPSCHRSVLLAEPFHKHFADQWRVASGLCFMESEIDPKRLAEVEESERCQDALIIEMVRIGPA